MSKFLVLILISFMLYSCSIPWKYSFQIENNTKYKIDTFQIGDNKDSTYLSIDSDSISKQVDYKFTGTIINVTEPMIYLTVLSYSDSTKKYYNEKHRGGMIGVFRLSKFNTNYLRVETDSLPPSFDFKFIEER